MRLLIMAVCLFTLVPLANAQSESTGPRGYVFFAPGVADHSSTIHFGGGGEFPIYKGLGAGGELGYLAPTSYIRDGFGVFSLNGTYDFLQGRRSAKVSPFATTGYSLGFRDGHVNGYNFGGGIHYWFADRMGLRAEFRDHVFEKTHFYGFRIGWTSR